MIFEFRKETGKDEYTVINLSKEEMKIIADKYREACALDDINDYCREYNLTELTEEARVLIANICLKEADKEKREKDDGRVINELAFFRLLTTVIKQTEEDKKNGE